MMKPSIYAKAIDVLNQRGHNQRTFGYAGGGPVCIEGSIRVACGHEEPALTSRCCQPAVRALWRATRFLWTWNAKASLEDAILLLKYADAGELETWKSLYGPGSEVSS